MDALKCIGYLHEKGISTKSITLCGHSLGAAVSIVNAGMLKNVAGVAVGAPAVRLKRWLVPMEVPSPCVQERRSHMR